MPDQNSANACAESLSHTHDNVSYREPISLSSPTTEFPLSLVFSSPSTAPTANPLATTLLTCKSVSVIIQQDFIAMVNSPLASRLSAVARAIVFVSMLANAASQFMSHIRQAAQKCVVLLIPSSEFLLNVEHNALGLLQYHMQDSKLHNAVVFSDLCILRGVLTFEHTYDDICLFPLLHLPALLRSAPISSTLLKMSAAERCMVYKLIFIFTSSSDARIHYPPLFLF